MLTRHSIKIVLAGLLLCLGGALLWLQACSRSRIQANDVPNGQDKSQSSLAKGNVNEMADCGRASALLVSSTNVQAGNLEGVVGIIALSADVNSEGDKAITGAYRTPDGHWFGKHETVYKILDYMRKHGEMPTSGLDLLPAELQSKQLVETSVDSDPVSFANKYAFAINPQTGRLYASFRENEWEPGGIFISPLEVDPDGAIVEGQEHLPLYVGDVDHDGKEDQLKPDGGLRYGVFGDSPGEVLWRDKMVWQNH